MNTKEIYVYHTAGDPDSVKVVIDYARETILLENLRKRGEKIKTFSIQFSDIVYAERLKNQGQSSVFIRTIEDSLSLEKGMKQSEELSKRLNDIAKNSPNYKSPKLKEWILYTSIAIVTAVVSYYLMASQTP